METGLGGTDGTVFRARHGLGSRFFVILDLERCCVVVAIGANVMGKNHYAKSPETVQQLLARNLFCRFCASIFRTPTRIAVSVQAAYDGDWGWRRPFVLGHRRHEIAKPRKLRGVTFEPETDAGACAEGHSSTIHRPGAVGRQNAFVGSKTIGHFSAFIGNKAQRAELKHGTDERTLTNPGEDKQKLGPAGARTRKRK